MMNEQAQIKEHQDKTRQDLIEAHASANQLIEVSQVMLSELERERSLTNIRSSN